MTAQIIYADFRSRTYHKAEPLKKLAEEIMVPIYESSLGFIEVPSDGVDGLWKDKS